MNVTPSLLVPPSQAKGLERLEEASGRRYLHVRPRRERGAMTALQIQNCLVHASVYRGRDAPFTRRDAREARGIAPAGPPASLTTQRIPGQSLACCREHRCRVATVTPPLAQCKSGNSGGTSSHAAAGLIRFEHGG
jgi:hypothetical protein